MATENPGLAGARALSSDRMSSVADVRIPGGSKVSIATSEDEPDWKAAFAAQSYKLQRVLHIPGVREELARIKWSALGEQEGIPHKRFRHEVLTAAQAIDGGDFAGDIDPFDVNTVEGRARSHAIIAAAYDFTVSTDGYLIGLVAGDMGWANTGIKVDPLAEQED